MKEFVTHLVVTRDEQASFATVKCVTCLKGNATFVTVSLEVEGVNIITCA